jgi:hypothetical protein
VNRAADGNQLSYLYSVMWPVFALLGIAFWWMLLHTDYDTVGLKGLRNQAAQDAAAAGPGAAPATTPPVQTVSPEDDPELAAYNARLAKLAAKGPKTWRNPESVVARRSR